MAMCETQVLHRHETHVSPNNAAGHWRCYVDGISDCDKPADVHVNMQYADGLVVERDMCRQCADGWVADVLAVIRKCNIPAMGIVEADPVWTITPLAATEESKT